MLLHIALALLLNCTLPTSTLGATPSWVPVEVKSIAQQCIDYGFEGQCSGPSDPYLCSTLYCATKRGNLYYKANVFDGTNNGTKCGTSEACKGGLCESIGAGHHATITGSTKTLNCI